MIKDLFLCPVCGYPYLRERRWTNNSGSDEICPSCGTHFGYDDAAGGDSGRREAVYRRRRDAWRAASYPWFSPSQGPPEGWNPEIQLEVFGD
jgi:hypothetical protein